MRATDLFISAENAHRHREVGLAGAGRGRSRTPGRCARLASRYRRWFTDFGASISCRNCTLFCRFGPTRAGTPRVVVTRAGSCSRSPLFEDVAFPPSRVVNLPGCLRAGDVLRLAFDFQCCCRPTGCGRSSRFDQPDVLIAGCRTDSRHSWNAHAGFPCLWVELIPHGKNEAKREIPMETARTFDGPFSRAARKPSAPIIPKGHPHFVTSSKRLDLTGGSAAGSLCHPHNFGALPLEPRGSIIS